ncbi:MAG: HAD family hydrolase [Chloroflexota bacterium]|nr:HAD family hydrolase [Chloroflexota bacterium]
MTGPEAILCIDIDGTLLDEHERMHPEDVKVLHHFPEFIQPVITTGRNLNSTKAVFRQNGLFNSLDLPWPGVFLNGGAGYLPFEKGLIQNCFTKTTRETLITLALAFPETSFTFFTIDAVYLVNPNQFSSHIAQIHYLNAIESRAHDIPEGIIKVMILEQDPDVLKRIQKETRDWEAEMGYTLSYAYEINPTGITKANTLMAVLEALDLIRLPIFIVGDAENDLSLFKLAQKSFAPNTAHKTVMECADHIIQRETRGILIPILEEI